MSLPASPEDENERGCFPPGWSRARVRALLNRYEGQSALEALAEDEAAYETPGHTALVVPTALAGMLVQIVARYGFRSLTVTPPAAEAAEAAGAATPGISPSAVSPSATEDTRPDHRPTPAAPPGRNRR